MSRYVVDASVAAKWLFPENHSEEARKILVPDHHLFVPDFFFIEVDNILCKRHRRGVISEQEAKKMRSTLADIPFHVVNFHHLSDAAFKIALKSGRSMYDCLYLATAVQQNGLMVTADKRFYEGILEGPLSNYILWVQDV